MMHDVVVLYLNTNLTIPYRVGYTIILIQEDTYVGCVLYLTHLVNINFLV